MPLWERQAYIDCLWNCITLGNILSLCFGIDTLYLPLFTLYNACINDGKPHKLKKSGERH